MADDRAEQAVAWLAAIVESSDDTIIGTDAGGTIISWNPAAERMYGYEAGEAIGRHVTLIVPPELRTPYEEVRARLLGGETIQHFETIRMRKDGSYVDISTSIYPVRDSSGRIVGTAGIARDITERRRAEEALSRLASVVEYSGDAITGVTPAGLVANWNPAAEQMYQYSVAEAIGRSISSMIVPPGYEADMEWILEEINQGRAIKNHETRRKRKDGSLLDVSVSISPIRDWSGKVIGMSSVARDISERKRAERLLRESEERFRRLAENAPDLIYRFEFVPRLRYVYMSSAVTQILGYSPEEFYADPRLQSKMIHPSDLPRFRAIMDGPISSEPLTFRWVHRNGHEVVLEQRNVPVYDDSGTLVAVEGISRDITVQKLADEALRAQKEEYRVILDSVPAFIWYIDRDSRVIRTNRGAAAVSGLTAAEIVGKTVFDLFVAEEAAEFHADNMRVISEGHPLNGTAESYTLSKGETRWWQADRIPYRDHRGEIVGVIVFAQDVTENKQLEQQLLRAQRLEAAGRVAGQVAHDFNNLLGPLVAYPELIRMELPDNHPGISYCDQMSQAARQMADINSDMLALSRRGLLRHEAVDVNTLAMQALSAMESTMIGLDLQLQLSPSLMPADGSSAQLLRVVSNLIANARDAMSGRGTLTLTTENVYVDKGFSHYDRVEMGEYVRMKVRDSGTGIPPKIVDRIFDPFFSTKAVGPKRGSGLGLAIVRSVIEDHKGYIDLESEPGAGSCFSIYLPVYRDTQVVPRQDATINGTESILVVDDDPLQQRVIRSLLSKLGYSVQVVAAGKDAVEFVKERPVDLVLLDMVMPFGMDGAETYRRITQVRPGQRAIVISGSAETERLEAALQMGARSYLRKPVTIDDLSRAVRAALDTE